MDNKSIQIDVKKIKKRDDLCLREKLREDTIQRYQLNYQRGITMEPVQVYKVNDELLLVDGFHRLQAAKKAGLTVINAKVSAGTLKDALVAAAKANCDHGLAWSRKEKRSAIAAYLKAWPERANGWIAEELRVDDATVRDVRGDLEAVSEIRKLDKFQGKDGKWYPRTKKRTPGKSKEHKKDSSASSEKSDSSESNTPSEEGLLKVKEALDKAEREAEWKKEIDTDEEGNQIYRYYKHGKLVKEEVIQTSDDEEAAEQDSPFKRKELSVDGLLGKEKKRTEEAPDPSSRGDKLIDESRIEDRVSRTVAELINFSFSNEEWDEDRWEEVFVFDGTRYQVRIQKITEGASDDPDAER